MKQAILSMPILLMSLLLVAGCISSGCGIGGCESKITGTSVVILKFEPELSRVTEDDKVNLYLQVQNKGAFDAKNVNTSLYLHGNFKEISEGRYQGWTKPVGKLRAPNTKLGTEGQTDEVIWQLQAPDVGPGVKNYPFEFKVDVAYDYEGSSWKKFPIVNYGRIQELRSQGTALPSGEEGALPAPLKIDINVYEPVIYDPGKENYVELKIRLEKVGDGYIKSRKVSNLDKVDCVSDLNCVDYVILKIPSEYLQFDTDETNGNILNCDFGEEPGAGIIEAEYNSRQASFINLVDGDYAQLDCRLKIESSNDGSNPLEYVDEIYPMVSVSTLYTHHITGSANIEVVKVVGR